MSGEPTNAQLRAALDLALEVAESRSSGRLPGRVRDVVWARRPPRNWRSLLRAALEEDDAFREAVGRLAWTWLRRPDGWEAELRALVEADTEAEDRDKELRWWKERAVAAEEALGAARRERDAARAAHSESTRAAGDATRRAGRLERELAGARDRLASAEGELAAARERAARAEAEAEDEERLSPPTYLANVEWAVRMADPLRRAASAAADLGTAAADLGTAAADLGTAAADLGTAAADLGTALAEVAAALPEPGDPPETAPLPEPPGRAQRPQPPPAKMRAAARRPLGLPPAVDEDSVEAAVHLVRTPNSELIVDGYNVALTSWGPVPSSDLAGLRARLVDSLQELALRHQRPVTVVFDGTGGGGRVSVTGAARRWLKVIFSSSQTEADEVIVETLRRLPLSVHAVVATNDRAVRDDSRRLGANVISVGQLLAALRRQPRTGGEARPG